MTKSDIVSALDELGYDPETAGEAIDDVFQVIAEALTRREKVILRGFGAFQVKTARGWVSRDIRTGERREIENVVIPFTQPDIPCYQWSLADPAA